MGNFNAHLLEIRADRTGQVEAHLACPPAAVPRPGQYSLGVLLGAPEEALPTLLFCSQVTPTGFWAAPPLPASWTAGRTASVRGPLGHGFNLPANVRRLALVNLADSAAPLLPLAEAVLADGGGVALFSDQPLPELALAVEAYPLSALSEALDWPDFLALHLPAEAVPGLSTLFGTEQPQSQPGRLACPAQALVRLPMPCGELGACGACAVPGRRGPVLACQTGPVFDLNSLKW